MPRRPRHSAAQLAAIREILDLAVTYGLDGHDFERIDHQLQRERQSAKEVAATLARQLIEFWGITANDLRGATPTPATVAPHVVKYRHPSTGETWDGAGTHPEWLRQALLKDGYRVAELVPTHVGATTS